MKREIDRNGGDRNGTDRISAGRAGSGRNGLGRIGPDRDLAGPRPGGSLAATALGIERRAAPRLAPAVDCRATIDCGRHDAAGVVEDLSPLGLRLRLPAAGDVLLLRAGDPVEVRLAWLDQQTSRRGTVAWLGPLPEGAASLGIAYSAPLEREAIPTLLDMAQVRVDPVWALSVPASLSMRRQVLPFACIDGTVHVACADLGDAAAMNALERFIRRPVRFERAEPVSLRRVLQRIYGELSASTGADDAAALCDEILHAAGLRGASDVHIDPERDGVRIRLRVDGQLEDYRRLASSVHAELISRIKVLGGIDIAEKRAPQDGRFTHQLGADQLVDIRVATLPTKYGERATLRLLAIRAEGLTLETLGMCARDQAIYEQSIGRPHGLLLATGPTGCGKTSTLYAAMRRIIGQRAVNAITVQDPIEYDIPGAAQVEVDSAQKVTFAKALRSILRHDPDVIMIGEIRDRETVDIAIKAALTGHLVLATLHTSSAVSAITRLCDMGVERYLTSATLRLVLAQRLVRRLCPYCRRATRLAEEQARTLGRPAAAGMEVFEPRGCVYCAGRGYNGRIGLFELLPLDESWSRAIAGGSDEADLVGRMRGQGIPSVLDDAIDKMRSGVTSLHEVLAAVTV